MRAAVELSGGAEHQPLGGWFNSCAQRPREAQVVVPYNKQLQRTVMHKVPRHIGQRAAAELRR
jgi:hypothetical protein